MHKKFPHLVDTGLLNGGVFKEKKASDYVKQALDALDVKEEITEKKDEKRTLEHMARLSRALRVAARERGALGDFKDVFAQDK